MSTFIATDEVTEILAEIKRVREHKEKVIEQEKYLMQRLYNNINEHERVIIIDEHGVEKELATWKYSKDTARFDSKTFKDDNPEMYELYVKISPGARSLRIAK